MFLQDCCVQGPNLQTTAKRLYPTFLKWAEESGERKMSRKKFGMKLAEHGFDSFHNREGSIWIGVALIEIQE